MCNRYSGARVFLVLLALFAAISVAACRTRTRGQFAVCITSASAQTVVVGTQEVDKAALAKKLDAHPLPVEVEIFGTLGETDLQGLSVEQLRTRASIRGPRYQLLAIEGKKVVVVQKEALEGNTDFEIIRADEALARFTLVERIAKDSNNVLATASVSRE
ncbi:MAG: hypothetical protein ABFD92_18230 [Planctomycetaceae bacterium]|nr:hypothetical protein [Planctomycetaceae bacterium]